MIAIFNPSAGPINSSGMTPNRAAEGDMSTEDSVILLDKFKVESIVFQTVKSQFEKTLPFLMPEIEYTWQDLLGEEFWFDMPGLPSHLASICLKHFAKQPESPLMVDIFSGCNPTYFQIRSQERDL